MVKIGLNRLLKYITRNKIQHLFDILVALHSRQCSVLSQPSGVVLGISSCCFFLSQNNHERHLKQKYLFHETKIKFITFNLTRTASQCGRLHVLQ